MRLPSSYPPRTRGTVVVWGLLANAPFGGMTWQVLHYLAGLRLLGFDVWYVEDNDAPMQHPRDLHYAFGDPTDNLRFLERQLRAIGLEERWIVRMPGSDDTFGGSPEHLVRLYREADAIFNLCAAHRLMDGRHDSLDSLVLIETDPIAFQVWLDEGAPDLEAQLDRYGHLFTYGQNLGTPECPVPTGRYRWLPTRPPVVMEWWANPPGADRGALTTVVNWTGGDDKDIEWRGQRYRWRKDVAFEPFLDLPARSALPLELAAVGMSREQEAGLRARGWRITSATALNDPAAYRDYIRASLGEFTAAKEQYVIPRSGWFSDRSVCYLAAGRPVVTQETGFSRHVPTGEGLFAVSDLDQAADAVEQIAADPERHARAAAAVAREHFEADRVISEIAEQVGLI
jgi:hypothetical protein